LTGTRLLVQRTSSLALARASEEGKTMCLLTYYPPGVEPVREHLENGARLNAKGHGWAAIDRYNMLHCHRSLDAAEMITSFMVFRAENPDSRAMFHSRYATGTATTLEKCHPMQVGNDPLTVMAHNGYLFPTEGESDTEVFARDILPRYDLLNPASRAVLEERMGPNKAVILSTNILLPRVIILNGSKGIMLPGGTWHSNRDYLGTSHLEEGKCIICSQIPQEGASVIGEGDILCHSCEATASNRYELLMEAVR
jgi:glutamine amidotransferase